jgi:hypothetical protein
MLDGFRRRRTGSGGGPRRRLGGCLLWVLGLLAEAEKNTTGMLDGMLRSLGFQQVTVDFSRAAG